MNTKPMTEGMIVRQALDPQDVDGALDGLDIEYPARYGEQITFVLNIGAASGTAPTIVVGVEGTDDDLDDSPTWAPLKEWDGGDDLEFDEITEADADSVIVGSLNLTRVAYKHLRLTFGAPGGSSTPSFFMSATAIIGHLRSIPGPHVETLYGKAHHEEYAA